MELDGLTDDQMEKLRKFQDIANLEEMDLAMVTLASCDWNLENAIEAHLGGAPVVRAPPVGISAMDYLDYEEDAPMMVEEARHAEPTPPMRSAAAASAFEALREPARGGAASGSSSNTSSKSGSQERRGTTTGVDSNGSSSGNSRAATLATVAAVVDSLGPREAAAPAAARMEYDSDVDDADYDYAMEEHPDEDDEEEAHRAASGTNGSAAARTNDFGVPLIPTDCDSVLEGTQNFQSVFEARYGKGGRGHLMPPFFIGSLSSAIRESFECPDRPVSERRPLALYIHHDRSVARNIFPHAVLCNDQVVGLLRSQFIVWPWDVTAKENEEKLVTWLNDASLYDARPIVATFANKVDRFPLLILLSKDGGQLRLVDFVQGSEGPEQAMQKLLTCMDAYATSKITLEKQEQERMERDLLRKEQERELQESLAVDRERAERQAREIREAKEAEERAVREREEKQARIASLKSSLPAEPDENAPDVCSVRFRLPEQGQALRRFTKSTPLSVMLTFLESEGFPVAEYRMMNSDFPQKKDITELDASKSLADLKFPAREVINVEER